MSAVRDEVGAVKRESRQIMQKVDVLAAEKGEPRANDGVPGVGDEAAT